MNRRVLPLIAAAVVTTLGMTQVHAQSADPTMTELKETLRRLQERVDQLEAAASRPTQAQVDSTRDAIRTDVDRKATLNAVSVSYDRGLLFKTGDGNFSLKPTIAAQFRYIASFGAGSGKGEDDESGFEVRRLRPRFQGNAFTPQLTYDFQFDVNRQGGTTAILDASVQYQFAKEWAVKLGQFKESWSHERDMNDIRQLAVERSLVDALIGGANTDRVQGVALVYGGTKDNDFRAELAFHDGAPSNQTGLGILASDDTEIVLRGQFQFVF